MDGRELVVCFYFLFFTTKVRNGKFMARCSAAAAIRERFL